CRGTGPESGSPPPPH
ncbi:TetW-regulatory peptide, partial [Dysosmobacter welbionis]